MIVAANWKMNPTLEQAGILAAAMACATFSRINRILFLPHPYLIPMSSELSGSDVKLGGQDCHFAENGAYTGDVSAAMLHDCGASIVLLGHSERRSNHKETNNLISQKVKVAISKGLDVVLCVGESNIQRDENKAEQIVIEQLKASIPAEVPKSRLIIAYEPVWAIGTGTIPSSEEIASMHNIIAAFFNKNFTKEKRPPILYGGSVNVENASDVFKTPGVDGVLVGGASLNKRAFDEICEVANISSSNKILR